jgi:SAM-dependent methyltransferase
MLEEDRADTRERYAARYREFGYDPRTLGWRKGRQRVRFTAALNALGTKFGSLLDVGCGFGDLFGYLKDLDWQGDYLGLDICPDLLDEGCKRFGPRGARFECTDLSSASLAFTADVAVALGVFNHRLKGDNLDFVSQMLHAMWAHSTQAIVVDFLSTTADRPKPELFHADAEVILRMALGYSKRVRLDHSYMPFEFLVAIWHDDSYSVDCPVFAPYLDQVRPQPPGESATGGV